MRAAALGAVLALAAGCAGGPRPLPADATPAERLASAEAALKTARGLEATFQVEAQGARTARLSGTLALAGGNHLALNAEGTFGRDAVRVELDARGDETSWSTTRGASVSSHRGPVADGLGEAVALALSRLGLFHDLSRLVGDEPVDHAQGGADAWLRPVELADGGPSQAGGVPCHLLRFGLEVGGARTGEATVCLADATSLPVERKATMKLADGELTLVERYTWTVR